MREFFIRVRTILIALLFIILITGFLVFPGQLADFAERIETQENQIRALLALAAVVADAILLFIIVQELRFRSRNAQGLLVRSRAISAEVSLESVQSNLDAQIAKLTGVFAARTLVRAERGRVAIEIDIDADDKSDIRKASKQIHREIVKIIEKQMGLKLGAKPVIRFRLMGQPAKIDLNEPEPIANPAPPSDTAPTPIIRPVVGKTDDSVVVSSETEEA